MDALSIPLDAGPALVNADFKRGRAAAAPPSQRPSSNPSMAAAGVVDLPVLGRIAAGTPI